MWTHVHKSLTSMLRLGADYQKDLNTNTVKGFCSLRHVRVLCRISLCTSHNCYGYIRPVQICYVCNMFPLTNFSDWYYVVSWRRKVVLLHVQAYISSYMYIIYFEINSTQCVFWKKVFYLLHDALYKHNVNYG